MDQTDWVLPTIFYPGYPNFGPKIRWVEQFCLIFGKTLANIRNKNKLLKIPKIGLKHQIKYAYILYKIDGNPISTG